MNKVVITVVGKDSIGIIAKVCTCLAKYHINILDIAQTIVDGYFNMMMIVDVHSAEADFATYSSELNEIAQEKGVVIHCQREEIFESMHRI